MPTEEISEEFVKNVQTLMRKPSEEEAVLGTQILTVMGLILGADEERFYQKSKNILEPLIKTSKNEKVKVQVSNFLFLFFLR
jgi:predicted nucleic acid-binding protein